MGEGDNIGHAILIVGSIALYFVYHLDLWVTIGLCLLALLTWSYHAWGDQRKHYFLRQTALVEAKIDYYRAKTQSLLRKETEKQP